MCPCIACRSACSQYTQPVCCVLQPTWAVVAVGMTQNLYAQGVPSRQADPSDTGPEFKTAPRTIHVQVAMAAWFLALTSQAPLAFRHPFFYALANGHPGVSRPPQLWFCPLLLVKALTGDFSGPFFWGPVSCSLCPRMVQFSLESSLRLQQAEAPPPPRGCSQD